ncbi:MAG: hypothetical protein ACRDLB_07435 [Actinomycetota bacterium]
MSPTRGVIPEAWEMYKSHLVHFASIAAVIWVFVAVVSAVIVETGSLIAALVGTILSTLGLFWVQGALVKAVQDVQDGRADLGIGETFRQAAPFIGRITGAGILAALGIAFGFLLLIVPGLILLTWWILITPAIVVENRGAMEAFGRSRDLVRGYGWEVFGVIVLTYVLLIVVGILLGLLLSPLDEFAASLISDLVSGIAMAPFVTVTWTLLYFRMAGSKGAEGPAAPPPTV